jgi:SAM-dependent methyltransferase
MVNKELLIRVDILEKITCCPYCGESLQYRKDFIYCKNQLCDKSFPIVGGIPVIINQDKSAFENSDFEIQKRTYFKFDAGGLKVFEALKKFLPTISHNLAAKKNFFKLENLLMKKEFIPKVLVIGAGISGEGIDAILSNKNFIVIESDVAFGPRTSIIADGHCLPFIDGIFDAVICQAVLEHVFDPILCIAEMYRVLGPDGLIYSETPFMQQVHGGRYDFTRFTYRGHRSVFGNFEEIDSGMTAGPAMAFAWSYVYLLQSFALGKISKLLLKLIGTFTIFPVKYLDYFLIKLPNSRDAASGFYFLGKKTSKKISIKEVVNY